MELEVQARTGVVNDQKTDLERRIRGEYREMPGLRLTVEQASRLWALEPQLCVRLLDTLVEAEFLQRDAGGRYLRRGETY